MTQESSGGADFQELTILRRYPSYVFFWNVVPARPHAKSTRFTFNRLEAAQEVEIYPEPCSR